MRRKPMTKARKIAILVRTRDLLARPRGWTKGTFRKVDYGPDGERHVSYCIAGAAHQAAIEVMGHDYRTNEWDAVRRLSIEALIRAKRGVERGSVATYVFNDDPKTRKQDVLDVIDEKIAELS